MTIIAIEYTMTDFFSCSKIKNVLLLGVGGISMSAIANYLLKENYNVFGTDISKNESVLNLIKNGVNFLDKFDINLIKTIDAIVFSSAIKESDLWIRCAIEKNIPIFKRSEVIGSIVKKYNNSIGVSGSHGKTTATSMISEIFIKAKKEPTVFLGGENVNFGNFLYGKDDFIIYEACEFKKNFLDMKPKCAVVLNIDNDHVDSYNNIQEQVETFSKFIDNNISFVNVDDKYSSAVNNISSITYGINNKAVYNAKNIVSYSNNINFDIYKYGKKISKIILNIGGVHNVYNALVSYAVADYYKIDNKTIVDGLNDFVSVKRRNEFLGFYNNTKIYADYAHHPTELHAIFKQYKNLIDNSLFVFQPHTFSRTKALLYEFIDVLSKFNNLIIYKTYSAREDYDYFGSAEYLAKKINEKNQNVIYFSNFENLYNEINKYDNVMFLGAGDIYDCAKKIVK